MGPKQGISQVTGGGGVEGSRAPRAWRNVIRESKRPGVRLSSTILPNQEDVGLAELEWGIEVGGSSPGSHRQAPSPGTGLLGKPQVTSHHLCEMGPAVS